MPRKQYIVTLTGVERQHLETLSQTGKSVAINLGIRLSGDLQPRMRGLSSSISIHHFNNDRLLVKKSGLLWLIADKIPSPYRRTSPL